MTKEAVPRILSQAELEKIVEAGKATVKKLDVPLFFASGWQLTVTGTEMNLVATRQLPVLVGDGDKMTHATMTDPVVCLAMSVQAAKDLSLILSQNVEKYEKQWGAITTPFSRKIAADKK